MRFEYDSEEIAFLRSSIDTILNGSVDTADKSMTLDYTWDMLEEYIKDNPVTNSGGVIV